MSRKKKIKRAKARPAAKAVADRQRRREFASYAANRHLRAYMVDHDHRHIANAWLAYRESGLRPDEGMAKAMDVLCREVLKAKNARTRLRNAVRNAELHRIVTAMRDEKNRIVRNERKPHPFELVSSSQAWRDLYSPVARDHGITVTNLKQIMRNMRK